MKPLFLRMLWVSMLVFGFACHDSISPRSELNETQIGSGVGVNLSRYRSAWAGCWVADPGYWNANCERMISAYDAVGSLQQTQIKKVKLFAPGRSPEQEFDWYFPMWLEDLKALNDSGVSYRLFIGIPNSALFELAGFSFSMDCGGQAFDHPTEAYESPLCGQSSDTRQQRVLRRILEILETKANLSIECDGRTYSLAVNAFDSGACPVEDINVAVANALLKDIDTDNLEGVQAWFDSYLGIQLERISRLHIESVGVGNEPLAAWYHDFYDAILPLALHKVQNYMDRHAKQFNGAKVTVPMAGTFASEPRLAEIVLQYLASIDSTFMMNIYPHSEVFNSVLNSVIDGQSTGKEHDANTLVISRDQLIFMQDFIAWGSGQPTIKHFQTGPRSFYEAYMEGYEAMLLNQSNLFSQALPLTVVAGETGWPTANRRVYDSEALNATFSSLSFNQNGEAKIRLETFKQIISNEMFNSKVAGHYAQNVVKYLNNNHQSAYLFQLHDETDKVNEASGMEYELEPFFGLHELQDNRTSPVDSRLIPKFTLDIFAQ